MYHVGMNKLYLGIPFTLPRSSILPPFFLVTVAQENQVVAPMRRCDITNNVHPPYPLLSLLSLSLFFSFHIHLRSLLYITYIYVYIIFLSSEPSPLYRFKSPSFSWTQANKARRISNAAGDMMLMILLKKMQRRGSGWSCEEVVQESSEDMKKEKGIKNIYKTLRFDLPPEEVVLKNIYTRGRYSPPLFDDESN